jgi:hypothetical protein
MEADTAFAPEPVAPPPSAPPPPPPPSVDMAEQINQAIPALDDGRERPVFNTPESAARFLSRRRREDQESGSQQPSGMDDGTTPANELQYLDGTKPADNAPYTEEIQRDAKTAAADLARYRSEAAAARLAEITGQQIEQPQATPAPEQQQYEARAFVAEIVRSHASAQKATDDYSLALATLLTGNSQQAQQVLNIRTPADLARIAADPAQLRLFQTFDAKHKLLEGELNKVRQHQAQHYAHQYSAYKRVQTELVEQMIPALQPNADPVARRQTQEQALDTLKGAGFTDQELYSAYVEGAPINMADARAQYIIWKASQYDAMQRKAHEAQRKHVPPVQRPGQPSSSYRSQGELDAMKDRLMKSGSLRDAAAFVAARRRAAR